jgi:predicted ribosomally synthesized peptide with SipW-like signal peptide
MKTRILASMLAIALAAAVIGGATMAWFSDTKESQTSVFQAGTLKIDVQGENVSIVDGKIVMDFGAANLQPGDKTNKVKLTVTNTGSLPIALFRKFEVSESTDNFAKQLLVHNMSVKDWSGTWPMVQNGSNHASDAPHDLSGFPKYPWDFFILPETHGDKWWGISLGTEDWNKTYEIEFEFLFSTAAGNDFQGANATLSTTFIATQKNATAILEVIPSGEVSLYHANRVANQVMVQP